MSVYLQFQLWLRHISHMTLGQNRLQVPFLGIPIHPSTVWSFSFKKKTFHFGRSPGHGRCENGAATVNPPKEFWSHLTEQLRLPKQKLQAKGFGMIFWDILWKESAQQSASLRLLLFRCSISKAKRLVSSWN